MPDKLFIEKGITNSAKEHQIPIGTDTGFGYIPINLSITIRT